MKKSDKALKSLLNLSEEFELKLDKMKDGEEFRFSEAEEEDEKQDIESEETEDESSEDELQDEQSSEETQDEPAPEPEKDSEEPAEKKPEEKDSKVTVKPKVDPTNSLQLNVAELYSKMEAAKTPSEVGLVLKSLLTMIQDNVKETIAKQTASMWQQAKGGN